MELNREQIIKACEHCLNKKTNSLKDCPDCKYFYKGYRCKTGLLADALALIKQQDEQIFKLENRLKECENGYEGTLYLDRCKLHDAEQKIKELTEKNERLRAVAYQSGDWSHGEHPMVVELDDINQIAEEMIGGKDVNKED